MLFSPKDISHHRAAAPLASAAAAKAKKSTTMLATAAQKLADIMPDIEHDQVTSYVSGGDWSMHDLAFHMLRRVGPAHLVAATWSMSERPCELLIDALADGRLLSMRLLVDWRVQVRCPKAHVLAKQHAVAVRVSSCHAKAFTLHNDEWDVAVVGSSNFTNNPRIEAGMIVTIPSIATFNRSWILAEIANAQPFGCDMRKGYSDGRK